MNKRERGTISCDPSKMNKRVLSVFVLSLIMISVFASFAFAQTTTQSSGDDPIKVQIDVRSIGGDGPKISSTGPDTSTWYGWFSVEFLGLGETWALIISSLMVMLILISGIYDILMGFSLFSNKTAQFLIAVGIGVIAGVSGTVRTIATAMFGIAGLTGAFAVAVGIVIPLVVFILLNFTFFKFFNKMRTSKRKTEIKSGAEMAEATVEGLGTLSKGFGKVGRQ